MRVPSTKHPKRFPKTALKPFSNTSRTYRRQPNHVPVTAQSIPTMRTAHSKRIPNYSPGAAHMHPIDLPHASQTEFKLRPIPPLNIRGRTLNAPKPHPTDAPHGMHTNIYYAHIAATSHNHTQTYTILQHSTQFVKTTLFLQICTNKHI